MGIKNCHIDLMPQEVEKAEQIDVEVWRSYYLTSMTANETHFEVESNFAFAQCYVSIFLPPSVPISLNITLGSNLAIIQDKGFKDKEGVLFIEPLMISGSGAKVDLNYHVVDDFKLDLKECFCTFKGMITKKKEITIETGIYNEILTEEQEDVQATLNQPNGQICVASPNLATSRSNGCPNDA